MTTQATPGARPMAMTGTGLVTALMTPNAGLADHQGTGQYSSRKYTIFQHFRLLKSKLSSCLLLYTLFLTILWKNIYPCLLQGGPRGCVPSPAPLASPSVVRGGEPSPCLCPLGGRGCTGSGSHSRRKED